jgi:hypothetical protein
MGPRASLEWCRDLVPTSGFNPESMQPVAITYTQVRGKEGYISTVTSASDGRQWLTSCPNCFNSVNGAQLNRRLDGPQCQSGRLEEKQHWPPKFYPRTGHEDLALAALSMGKKRNSHCSD